VGVTNGGICHGHVMGSEYKIGVYIGRKDAVAGVFFGGF
jgi:hypothetical protein